MNTYYTDFRVKIHAKSIEEAIAKSRKLEDHIMDHHNETVFIKSIGLSLTDRQRKVGDKE